MISKIKEARELKGLKQEDVANELNKWLLNLGYKANYSQREISRWELGVHVIKKARIVEGLSFILDISIKVIEIDSIVMHRYYIKKQKEISKNIA